MAPTFAGKLRRFTRRNATPRVAAWVALGLLALASFFPPAFSATARLAFETGIQPPAGAVRGVTQLLSGRELARDTLARLPAADVARLSGRSLAELILDGGDTEDADAIPARAARRLMAGLGVAPIDNGRGVGITVSAPTPNLAARAANAYAAAFLALDAGVRGAADGTVAMLPVKAGLQAQPRYLPNSPAPLALVLLAMGTVILLIADRFLAPRRQRRGRIAGEALPVPVRGRPGVAWLDGGDDAGLPLDDAARRLAARLEGPATGGRLTLFSADDERDASAELALRVARRLSESARVVLVALDGTAGPFATLVNDPLASGVSELLFGVAGFGETIHRDALSHAHVIPPGRDARGDTGMLASERLPMVLESLRRTYDHVIVGAPGLAGAPGAAALAEIAPLLVCIHPDRVPATAAVEAFDALAGARFPQAVMLRLATQAARKKDTPVLPSIDAEAQPPLRRPSLHRHADDDMPRLAGAA